MRRRCRQAYKQMETSSIVQARMQTFMRRALIAGRQLTMNLHRSICLMKFARSRDAGAMFTHSYRKYSQSRLRVSSSYTNSNPPWDAPTVHTATSHRAMFLVEISWAQSRKKPDMERPFAPYPKRGVTPCETGFSRACNPRGVPHGLLPGF